MHCKDLRYFTFCFDIAGVKEPIWTFSSDSTKPRPERSDKPQGKNCQFSMFNVNDCIFSSEGTCVVLKDLRYFTFCFDIAGF